MKELSIEQKAKAYDEVREKIALRFGSNVAEEIFSEFEMNEDERIRGAIIDHLKDNNLTEWADWLEKQVSPQMVADAYLRGCDDTEKKGLKKQSEQKAFDYENVNIQQKDFAPVEPKFKVGDWIVGANNVFKIISLNNELNCYIAVTQNNEEVKILYYFDDEQGHMCSYHLWTIQDAKPGDVLADKYNNIGIFQECKGICWHSYIYLGCDGELRGFNIGGSHEQTGTHPATKEQRNFLFKKMKEAGYIWDDKKKDIY